MLLPAVDEPLVHLVTTMHRLCAVSVLALAVNASAGAQDAGSTAVLEVRIHGHEQSWGFLSDVGGLAVSPSGTMIISQPRERLLRAFSATGSFVGQIGRAGDGPGEFRRPIGMGFLADTLYVIDNRRRVHLYLETGRHVATFDTPPVRLPPPAGPVYVVALLAGRGRLNAPGVQTSSLRRGEAGLPIAVTDSAGGDAVVIALQAPPRGTMLLDGGMATFPQIERFFGDHTLVAPAADGRSVIVVERSVHSGSGTATFRVLELGLNGDTIFARSVPYDPMPVTRRDADSVLASAAGSVSSTTGATPQAMARAIRQAMRDVPAYRPPVSRLLAGRDGTIWLEQPAVDASRQSWLVLGGDGRAVGRLSLESNGRLLQADRTHIWMLERDSLDVPSVARYRIGLR